MIDQETVHAEWFKARVALAVAFTSSEDTIKSEHLRDQQLNPHGDSYKPARRSTDQIVSDCKFRHADNVLGQQFGAPYFTWLKSQGFEQDPHTHAWKQRNKALSNDMY